MRSVRGDFFIVANDRLLTDGLQGGISAGIDGQEKHMAHKPPKTFHPLEVSQSLVEQSQKVGMLLMVVRTVLSLNGNLLGATELAKAAEECRSAMYPEDDE